MPARWICWKRFTYVAGTMLALLGVVFVVLQLRRYGASVDLDRVASREWVALTCLIIVGVGMNACLGMAWRAILLDSGSPVPMRWAVATYAATHVARYVPGNIFHYAGRQAIGMAAGLPARVLVRASLLELALVGVAGGLLSLFAAPLVLPSLGAAHMWSVGVALILGAAVLAARRHMGPSLAKALSLYLIYLSLSGLTFLVAILIHAPQEATAGHDWVVLCAAYVIAWLIGMLTPGAPAGLGVRELVILFLLHERMDAATLLFAVLATRVVAIGADTLAWGIGLGLRRQASYLETLR